MKSRLSLMLFCVLCAGSLLAAEADIEPSINAEERADAASKAPQSQQQIEETARKRKQDAEGQTVRMEEKNRVRTGELGSDSAHEAQARNQARKSEKDSEKAARKAERRSSDDATQGYQEGSSRKRGSGTEGKKGKKGKKGSH
jgi:hypothetical protein